MNNEFDYKKDQPGQGNEAPQVPVQPPVTEEKKEPIQAEISQPAFPDSEQESSQTAAKTKPEETGFVLQGSPSAPSQEPSYYTAPREPQYQASAQQEHPQYEYRPQYYAPQPKQGGQPGSNGPARREKRKKEKKPKDKMARIMVATIAICTVASLALGGVSGALVTSYLMQNQKQTTSQGSSSGSTSSTGSGNTVYTESPGTDGSLSISGVVQKVGDSVVAIDVSNSSGEFKDIPMSESSSGSGVIISSDGYIVTNNHVVEGGNTVKVYLRNGDSYDAQIIGTDKTTDLALLKIEATDLIYAQFGDSSALQVGDTAIAIGNPLGLLHGTATTGIISALDRELTIDNETMNLLQTDASISPGNSGGGLFNAKGELIGIVNAKSSAEYAEGIGFAIPINDVKPVVEALKENGYVTGRPVIGVSMIDISTQAMANMYRVTRLGVYVYDVTQGGPAAQAGLQSGDCIVSVNGTNVSTSSEVSKIVKQSKVGDKLTFVLYRGDEQKTVEVTVGEQTAQQSNS